MKPRKPSVWKTTLVQHSAFVGKGDPRFEFAVEPAHLHTEREIERVRAAGGILIEPNEAEARCEAANYPEEVKGLIPRVKGSFSKKLVEGSPIYLQG